MSRKLKPKQFETPTMKALLDLSGGVPHLGVKLDYAFASVLAEMNLSEMDYGMQESAKSPWVRRWFISALKNKQRHGHVSNTGRGFWALTVSGLALAQNLTGQQPVVLVPVPVVQAKVVTVEETRDESPVVVEPAPPVVEPPVAPVLVLVQPESVPEPVAVFDPSTLGEGVSVDYDEDRSSLSGFDPYLLSIMVEQTNCFGSFSTRSATCKNCPLVAACKRQVIISMAEMAEEMNRMVALETTVVENPAAAPANEIPDLVAHLSTRKQPTSYPVVVTPPQNAQRITAAFELTCEGCSSPIEVGAECFWVEGTGATHTSCSASHSA